ncbi:MAG: sulfatase [Gemmatimonadetes bacterium]|nr:sulfatase [Gemmatimonadota bacterium]
MAFGLVAGLVTGLIEAAVILVQKLGFNRFRDIGFDIAWMAPLAGAVLLGVVGAAVFGLARGVSAKSRALVVSGIIIGLAVVSLVSLAGRIHHVAVLVLATGVAARLAPLAVQVETVRRPWLVAMAVGLVGLFGAAGVARGGFGQRGDGVTAVRPSGARPNILLVVLDTEAASSLRLHGYHRPTSDLLERVAAEGVVFDRAYATAPWTLPSHASLFTGLEAHALDLDFQTPLGRQPTTLAEVLGAAGYRTGGFVANLRYTNREFGLARGFQHYEDFPRTMTEVALSSGLVRRLVRSGSLRRLVGYHDIVGRRRAPEITKGFLDWVEGSGGQPWFAFLNYWDAHEPYRPPADLSSRFGPAGERAVDRLDYRTREVILWPSERRGLGRSQAQAERDAYDASLVAVDRSLEVLLEGLRRQGILDQTVVVITADHGEEHGERGDYTHAATLNPNALWVPLVVRYPPSIPKGVRVTQDVSLRRVPSTLLDLAGVIPPAPFPGATLRTAWEHSIAPGEAPVSSLKLRGVYEYSVILDSVQYRRRGTTERLTRMVGDGDPLPNLATDSGYSAVVARAREVLLQAGVPWPMPDVRAPPGRRAGSGPSSDPGGD